MRQAILDIIEALPTEVRTGQVLQSVGMMVEASCPGAFIGEWCEIQPRNNIAAPIPAEVIGFREHRALLMPYRQAQGISQGNAVIASGKAAPVMVGDALVGRVIDAFGEPLDGQGPIVGLTAVQPQRATINPMLRAPINEIMSTGIRAIDGFLTFGSGQRVGLMAGSGVGKSSLLSAICQHIEADVNVVALIGERGREVEEFVNQTLGPDGLAQSVVVSATAQESALVRIHAAQNAISIAEHFARQGKNVFFTMDSVTRYAMALREVGLAAGEPPTVKGYTPSVFAAIPNIIERCGNFQEQGSITALFTVLVEGDDLNDPVVDSVRAIMDGHIVLSRFLAERGHYPAIDIGKSVSRLFGALNDADCKKATKLARQVWSDYQQNKDILDLGLFQSGDDARRNALVANWRRLEEFLLQGLDEASSLPETQKQLLSLAEQ